MKLISLLSLCSLIILVPSCCKQRSCCPTTATYCDAQPVSVAPYAVAEEAPVVVTETKTIVAPAAVVEEIIEDYDSLEESEEPRESEKKEAPSAADKESLELAEAVEAEKAAAEKEVLEAEEAIAEVDKATDKEALEEAIAEVDKATDKEALEEEGELELDETSEEK